MLEWLSKLIPDHIHLNLDVSPKLIINNVKVTSQEGSESSILIDGDSLIINDSTQEGAKIAKDVIKALPENLKHNDIMLEDSNLEQLEAINYDIKHSDYDKQLKKFKSAVPKKDWLILEVAILICIKFRKDEPIGRDKAQLVSRYGARGAMISNLYSSGYFDTLIYPLYQSMNDGTIALDEYLETYEMIVTESPLALFVGVGSPKEKIKQQLLEKIDYNKKHDVGYLNIHGIGRANELLINSLLKDQSILSLFTEEPSIAKLGKAIKATIFV